MSVGERIKYIRENLSGKKISMQEFADSLGVSKAAIHHWENGTGGRTAPESAIRLIAKQYNISEAWLLTGEGNMKEPLSRNEEIAEIVANLAGEVDGSFKLKLVRLISDMTVEELKMVRDMAKKLADEEEGH